MMSRRVTIVLCAAGLATMPASAGGATASGAGSDQAHSASAYSQCMKKAKRLQGQKRARAIRKCRKLR